MINSDCTELAKLVLWIYKNQPLATCEQFNHSPEDYHGSFDVCAPMSRYCDAMVLSKKLAKRILNNSEGQSE